jgi:hypothetical protein
MNGSLVGIPTRQAEHLYLQSVLPGGPVFDRDPQKACLEGTANIKPIVSCVRPFAAKRNKMRAEYVIPQLVTAA